MNPPTQATAPELRQNRPARIRPSAVSTVLRSLPGEDPGNPALARQPGASGANGSLVPPPSDPDARIRIEGNLLRLGPGEDLVLRVAHTAELRKKAWRLAYEVYQAKGYATTRSDGLWFSKYDLLPNTMTFVVERSDRPVAALTVVFDGELGLPADEVYADEIAPLRASGRRLCELVSLVCVEENGAGAALVKQLFKMAWLAGYVVEQATDCLITVNPRHVFYYEAKLLFRTRGQLRDCPKVNAAPARLLHLDLLTAPREYWRRGRHRPANRNLLRYFLNQSTPLSAWIRAQRRPLPNA